MVDTMLTGWSTAEEAATKFASEINGKNVLVTGTTLGGIGAETARVIAKYAALTIIAGRSLDKLVETETAIKREFPDANVRLLVLVLADFESVRHAAKEVNAYSEALDVLINNAAVLHFSSFATLKNTDIEVQFGTNHLGPFLFTCLVKPRLAASPSPRIVNVASEGHRYSALRPEASFGPKGEEWTTRIGYGQSKTANMLFTVSIAERWKDIGATSFSLHPGIIKTNISPQLSFAKKLPFRLYMLGVAYGRWMDGSWRDAPLIYKSIPQGAMTTIVAAFDPKILDQSGSYLYNGVVNNTQAMPYAQDKVSYLR